MSPATINASRERLYMERCELCVCYGMPYHAVSSSFIFIFFLIFFLCCLGPLKSFSLLSCLMHTHTQKQGYKSILLSLLFCVASNVPFQTFLSLNWWKKDERHENSFELNKWNDVHDFVKGNFIWLLMKVTLLCKKGLLVLWYDEKKWKTSKRKKQLFLYKKKEKISKRNEYVDVEKPRLKLIVYQFYVCVMY